VKRRLSMLAVLLLVLVIAAVFREHLGTGLGKVRDAGAALVEEARTALTVLASPTPVPELEALPTVPVPTPPPATPEPDTYVVALGFSWRVR